MALTLICQRPEEIQKKGWDGAEVHDEIVLGSWVLGLEDVGVGGGGMGRSATREVGSGMRWREDGGLLEGERGMNGTFPAFPEAGTRFAG